MTVENVITANNQRFVPCAAGTMITSDRRDNGSFRTKWKYR